MKPTNSAPKKQSTFDLSLLWFLPSMGILLLAGLTACSTTTPTSGIDSGTTQGVAAATTSAWDGFCSIAKPIGWSSKDTPETVLEVKLHNHLGAVHCGWQE